MNPKLHESATPVLRRPLRWYTSGIAILVSAVLTAYLVNSVASDEKVPKFASEAEAAASKKRSAIQAELKKLGEHAWAGEYYHGDGLGVNVSFAVAPKAGFVFEWHGCLGCYDRNYGPVEWKDGTLRLIFTFENKKQGFQGIAQEFIPVAWGARHYLVPADDVIGFCNSVNRGMESRYASYPLRRGDEEKKVEGFPKVPEKYREYLLEKPIEAKITAVGKSVLRPSIAEWKFKDTTVTIDAGRLQGLRPGMELNVIEGVASFATIRVTKVEENQAEGVMEDIGEEAPGPKTGWRLSTALFP